MSAAGQQARHDVAGRDEASNASDFRKMIATEVNVRRPPGLVNFTLFSG